MLKIVHLGFNQEQSILTPKDDKQIVDRESFKAIKLNYNSQMTQRLTEETVQVLSNQQKKLSQADDKSNHLKIDSQITTLLEQENQEENLEQSIRGEQEPTHLAQLKRYSRQVDDKMRANIKLFDALYEENLSDQERLEKITEAIKKGVDVNDQDIGENGNENTPLHIAVKKNYKEIVEFLLTKGAKVNVQNSVGKTPLDLAEDQEIINIFERYYAGASIQSQDFHEKSDSVNPQQQTKLQPEQSINPNQKAQQASMVRELKISYSPNKPNLWNSVKDNQEIRILEIDSKQFNPDFLEHDTFYSALNNAENLFFIDIDITGLSTTPSEEVIKNKLKGIKGSLVIQCVLQSGATVYIKESGKNKTPVVIDLNTNAEKLDESAITDSTQDTFGFSLIVNTLKSEIVGKFNNGFGHHNLRKITFDTKKELDNYKLIDYVAFRDDFLSARFLSLCDWNLDAANSNGERTLEIAAQYASVDTLSALLDLQLPLAAEKIVLKDSKIRLLSLVNKDGDTPLLIAVKNNKMNNVRLLIQCDVDINYHNINTGQSAIDSAWTNKYYDIVLALLKADSDFSINLTLDDLSGNDNVQEQIKQFIEERNKLHDEFITEGNLEKVKEFIANNKSKFYLNSKGQSATHTAIENKQYQIYALLKSKGADFRNKSERECISNLEKGQKESLKKAMIPYFPSINKAHIFYLMSKSKSKSISKKLIEDSQKKIEDFYTNLDSIPEVSTILKVLQYADYLDIIFDFDNENIKDVNPTASDGTKGTTDYKEGRLYIAAGMEEAKILGTLAHELAHMAMQIIYENDCNPYRKSENIKITEFKAITESIKDREDIKEAIKNIEEATQNNIDIDDSPIITLARAFRYPENEQQSELIVRVPHVLTQYGEEGRKFLSPQVEQVNEFKKLLNYYKGDEKSVISDYDSFVERSFLIKPKNIARLLNQSVGEINNIIEYNIHFKNSIDLSNFFDSQDKKILLLNTENTLLSSLNVYQTLQNISSYSSRESFLFFKFDRYVKQQQEIYKAFNMEASNLLILEYSPNSNKEQLPLVLKNLSMLLSDQQHKNKRVIFIIQEDKDLKQVFEENLNQDKYLKQEDQSSFVDLTEESQSKLLKKKLIIFQGQEQKVSLSELMGEESKRLIDSGTLVKLIHNDEIKIGNELKNLGEIRNYYIPRSFNQQVTFNKKKINKDIEDKKILDFFVISGTDSGLASNNNKIYVFDENDHQLAKDKFQELRNQKPGFNIHWLRSESERLIWKKSHGSVVDLMKYKELGKVDRNDDKTPKKENDLIKKLVNQKGHHKIMILSDMAGMGKSTVLTSLSSNIQATNPKLWLIRIDLNAYTKVLAKELQKRESDEPSFNNWEDIKPVVEFLLNTLLESQKQSKLTSNLEKELFKNSLINGQGEIVLLFDGFDEISPNYKGVVIDLLQVLRKSKTKKLFIATRPNMREVLEEKLGVFAYTLEPFSREDQKDFLTDFWTTKLGSSSNQEGKKARLAKYADTLIDKFSNSINDKEKEFIGIPIHLAMIAESFQENKESAEEEWQGCKEFLDNNNEEPKLLPEKFNLCSLYDNFVKKKFYDFYLQDKKGRDFNKPDEMELANENYENFKRRHETLALYRLLSNEGFQTVSSEEGKQKLDDWMKDINSAKKNEGIIDQIIDNKPHFIHLTFAEYFASFPLVEKFTHDYTTALQYINSIIDTTSPVFINNIIKRLDTRQTEIIDLLEGKTLLNLVTQKGYLNFVKALLEAGYNDYPNPDNLDKTPLHYAAEYCHSDIVKYLLNYNNDILEDDVLEHGSFKKEEYADSKLVKFIDAKDTSDKTALYYAIQKGNTDIAFKLLLKGASIDLLGPEDINPLTNVMLQYDAGKKLFNNGILAVYANQDNKYRPIQEKLLLKTPNIFNSLSEKNQSRLLSYFFVHGRVEVIDTLLISINDEEKKRRLLNAEDHGYTPLDRVNFSDHLSDKARLAITKYLVKNGGIEAKYNVGHSDKNTDSRDSYITKILQAAAEHGHIETFRDFIYQENSDYYYLHLYRATENQQFNIIQYLLNYHREDIRHNGNTALHSAVDSGASLKIIKYFIDNGEKININAQNDQGETPLFQAIYADRKLNVIKYLVYHGADVNIPDTEGNTALYYAIKQYQQETVKYLLLKCKAEISDKYKFYLSDTLPLHLAIQSNDLVYSKFFIRQGVNINKRDQNGKTALHWASELQQIEIVELLLQYGAIFDAQDINNRTPRDLLSQSARNLDSNDSKKIIWLLNVLNRLFSSQNLMQNLEQLKDWGPYGSGYPKDVYDGNNPMLFILNARNAKGKTLLHIAADTNDERAIELLLKLNHDYLGRKAGSSRFPRYKDYQSTSIDIMDFQDNTPLHIAAQKGYDEIVRLLLNNGAIFNTENNQGQTPETLAKNNHHDNIIKLLQPTKDLFIAIEQNNLVEVKNCINEGAYINAKDKNGKTPLHFSASSGESNIVQLLLNKGANIDVIDIYDWTPLHFAVANDQIEIIKLLLKNGASFNAKNKQDKAPFDLKSNKSVNLLKAINGLFNDIISDNPDVVIEHLKIVQKDHETDISTIINSRDNEGNTILYYAAESGYYDIIQFLLENGAIFDAKNKLGYTPTAPKGTQVLKLLKSIEEMFENPNRVYQNEKKISILIITNVRNDQGTTLLCNAAEYDSLKVVKWLVKHGANVNAEDNDGKTALHLAAERDSLEVVKWLVKYGANVNAKDKNDQTALDLTEDEEIVKLLQQTNTDLEGRQGPSALEDNVKIAQEDNFQGRNTGSTFDSQKSRSESLESLEEARGEVGLRAASDSCAVSGSSSGVSSRRKKRDICREDEVDDLFPYEPLEETAEQSIKTNARLYSNIAYLFSTQNLDYSSSNINPENVINYNRNLGDIISEGEINHSKREEELLKNHYQEAKEFISRYPKDTLLNPVEEGVNLADSHWLFDNGRHSLLVSYEGNHYRIYSQDYNYRVVFQSKEEVSFDKIEQFARAFFRWRSGSSEYQIFTLAKNLPQEVVDKLQQAKFWQPDQIASDFMLLDKGSFSHIEKIPAKVIRELFFLGGQVLELTTLHEDFFEKYLGKISLRVEEIHNILPALTEQESKDLINLINRYDLPIDKTYLNTLPESSREILHAYHNKVNAKLKQLSNTDLDTDPITIEDLSDLSWKIVEDKMGEDPDISPELKESAIKNVKDLHASASTRMHALGVTTQTLFFLPDIIRSVNNDDYQQLAKLGGMIGGDMAFNKLYESLINKLEPVLASSRISLLKKLPITSPIFKVLTIHSIVELTNELSTIPADSERRSIIKHQLGEQYFTVGLMVAEMFGFELGPLWIGLMAEQLIYSAISLRKQYHLDISFGEALLLSLGFEKQKLQSMLEERSIVDINLSLVNTLSNQTQTNYDFAIVKVAKVLDSGPQAANAVVEFEPYNHYSCTEDNVFLEESSGYKRVVSVVDNDSRNCAAKSPLRISGSGLAAIYSNKKLSNNTRNIINIFDPNEGDLELKFTVEGLQELDKLDQTSAYNKTAAYIVTTKILHKPYPDQIGLFGNKNHSLVLNDNSKRVISKYYIDGTIPFKLQDDAVSTSIMFLNNKVFNGYNAYISGDTRNMYIESIYPGNGITGNIILKDKNYLNLNLNFTLIKKLKVNVPYVDLLHAKGRNSRHLGMIEVKSGVLNANMILGPNIQLLVDGSSENNGKIIIKTNSINPSSVVFLKLSLSGYESYYSFSIDNLQLILDDLNQMSRLFPKRFYFNCVQKPISARELCELSNSDLNKNIILIMGKINDFDAKLTVENQGSTLETLHGKVKHIEVIHYNNTVLLANNLLNFKKVVKPNEYNSSHYYNNIVKHRLLANWLILQFSSNAKDDLLHHFNYDNVNNKVNINGINYLVQGNRIYAALGDQIDGSNLVRFDEKRTISVFVDRSLTNSTIRTTSLQERAVNINNATLYNLPDKTMIIFQESENKSLSVSFKLLLDSLMEKELPKQEVESVKLKSETTTQLKHVVNQQLKQLDAEIVNGLKYLLANIGIKHNVETYQSLGFVSSIAQEQFINAHKNDYDNQHLQILQHDQVVEALIWLIAQSYSNNLSRSPNDKRSKLVAKIYPCFQFVIDKRIIHRLVKQLEKENIVLQVRKFVKHYKQTMKDRMQERVKSYLNNEYLNVEEQRFKESIVNNSSKHQRVRREINIENTQEQLSSSYNRNSNYQHSHHYLWQSEPIISGATKQSSWINDLLNSGISKVMSLSNSLINRLFIDNISSNSQNQEDHNSFSEQRSSYEHVPPNDNMTILAMRDYYLSRVDLNGTIALLDMIVRKVTGKKHSFFRDKTLSQLAATSYAVNITQEFKKVLKQAAKDSDISEHRLNIDFLAMQDKITRKIMGGRFFEIAEILNSHIEQICPSRESGYPGRLSPKKFNKFMTIFNNKLEVTLDQSMLQMLYSQGDMSNSYSKESTIAVEKRSTNINPTVIELVKVKTNNLVETMPAMSSNIGNDNDLQPGLRGVNLMQSTNIGSINGYFGEYTLNAIENILELRVNDAGLNNISIARGYVFYENYTNLQRMIDDLIDSKSEIILAPLNLHNKHAVGIMAVKNQDNGLNLYYIDPSNETMPDMLKQIFIDNDLHIEQLAVDQQKYANCGPEVIENFMLYLTGERLLQEESIIYHSQLVEQQLVSKANNPNETADRYNSNPEELNSSYDNDDSEKVDTDSNDTSNYNRNITRDKNDTIRKQKAFFAYNQGNILSNEAWEAESDGYNDRSVEAEQKFAESLQFYQEAVKLSPTNITYKHALDITSLKIEGNSLFSEGMELAEIASKLEDEASELTFNYQYYKYYKILNNYQQALEFYQSAQASFSKGWFLSQDSRFNCCIEIANSAIELIQSRIEEIKIEIRELIQAENQESTNGNDIMTEIENSGTRLDVEPIELFNRCTSFSQDVLIGNFSQEIYCM